MNIIKKLINFIKTNYKLIVLIIVFIMITFFSYNELIDLNGIEFDIKIKCLIFTIIAFIEILLFILVRKMYKRKISIEKLFLMIVIPIGFLYMIIIPVGRVPDEEHHFYRSYEISYGNLVSSKNNDGVGGQNLDSNIKEIFKNNENYGSYLNNFNVKKSNKQNFIGFPNTSLYSFICYIPQATGIFIGRILNLPLIFLAYLGRLFNFIAWTLLIYFSIKLIPYKKILVLLFAFMPMMLQEAVSLSADSLTNGIAFFLISYILYIKNRKEKINNKNYIILFLLSIILSLCKIVYLPMCLALFIIPYNKFKSKKDKYMKIGIILFSTLCINLIWLTISSSYLIEFNEGVDSSLQTQFILNNPITYIKYMFSSLYYNFIFCINNIIGLSLCNFDVNLFKPYIIIYLFIIIYSLLTENTDDISKSDKLIMALIIIFIVVLITTSLYVQWNKVASNVIEGMQGRYFIPILLPFAIICNNKYIKIGKQKKKLQLLIYYFVIFINIYAIMAVFLKHL